MIRALNGTTTMSLSNFAKPSFFAFLAVVACSSSPAGKTGDGGNEPEKLGQGSRQSGSLTILGTDIEETKVDFDGAYNGAVPDAAFVRCSYGNDPDATGEKRIRITLGYTGRPHVADVVLRDWKEIVPFQGKFAFDGSLSRQLVSAKIRRSVSEKEVALYDFGQDATQNLSSLCHVWLDEFSGEQISGSVACRELVEATPGKQAISATIEFDCPLSDIQEDPSTGTGGGPSNECAEGTTESCLGVDSCPGTKACADGKYGECVCDNGPRLLLKLMTPSSSGYEGIIEQTTGSYLESTAQTMGSQGYVVTAGVANTVPYTLWGTRPKGSTTKYDAKMEQTTGSYLSSVVASMGADGFLPTVGMANTVPYSIIGMKAVGSSDTYETVMVQTDGNGLDSELNSMGADGYIPMIGMANTVPYTIIGVRKKGSTKTYTTVVNQTTGSGLDATASSMTSSGYVITIAMQNSVPYTLIGVKDAAETWSLSAQIDQTLGSGLSTLHTSMSGNGFLVLAATGDPTPYTFYGTKVTLP